MQNSPPEVLIIDDTPAVALLKQALREKSMQCVVAHTNAQAIELLDKHAKTLRVVIVDLYQLHNSAFEFLYEMRSYQDLNHIAVVVYASETLPREVTESVDWKLLDISATYYKSVHTVRDVVSRIVDYNHVHKA